MENNIINLRTDNYIHQRAFCAVDAENSIKEQFLDRIGVEIDGKKVRSIRPLPPITFLNIAV